MQLPNYNNYDNTFNSTCTYQINYIVCCSLYYTYSITLQQLRDVQSLITNNNVNI